MTIRFVLFGLALGLLAAACDEPQECPPVAPANACLEFLQCYASCRAFLSEGYPEDPNAAPDDETQATHFDHVACFDSCSGGDLVAKFPSLEMVYPLQNLDGRRWELMDACLSGDEL
jgi:hypothetical protein